MNNKALIIPYVLVHKDGSFLIIKRASHEDAFPNVWEIPGGASNNELPEEAARRELKEEAGIEVGDMQVLFESSNRANSEGIPALRLVYLGEFAGGEIALNPDEHSKHAWIGFDEIEVYEFIPFVREVLEMIRDKSHPLLAL